MGSKPVLAQRHLVKPAEALEPEHLLDQVLEYTRQWTTEEDIGWHLVSLSLEYYNTICGSKPAQYLNKPLTRATRLQPILQCSLTSYSIIISKLPCSASFKPIGNLIVEPVLFLHDLYSRYYHRSPLLLRTPELDLASTSSTPHAYSQITL
jgi:hypothetical protein